jgi:glucose/arabinose dehydrogenase
LVLARAKLGITDKATRMTDLQVLWRQMPKGMGGQEGAQIAFSPDGQSLFLTVGDRQRFTPAQDPNQPEGKFLHLTLDGKPAPDNPNYGKTGASTIPLIDPPKDTEDAKTAKVVSVYTFPGPNMTPAETWASGIRTPYGLAFSPAGELWEVEHGPRGGDELNLVEKGKNYGWPLVSYGVNYDGVPIPSPDTRPDLAKPVLYWVPVIAPGNLMFYTGTQTFPQWNGSGLVSGLGTRSLSRIIFDGHGGAKAAERWTVGKRIRDVEEGPDGSLWMLEDGDPGALIHVTPK